MSNYSLKLDSVTKIFGRRLIFDKLSYSFEAGKVYGISGPNGSGKSTLSKIIAGIITPTSGKIIHKIGNSPLKIEQLHDHIGFVSPYLMLYDEFTALENLEHFSRIRGTEYNSSRGEELLNRFDIFGRRNDYVKTYSSGMKQRLKFVFAFLHNPELLILDEPTSNLDNKGKEAVYSIIKDETPGKVIIVASNEDADLSRCGEVIYLENFKMKSGK